MQEIRINTFTEFHQIIENYEARTVIYRGMKSIDCPLIPKIGRVVPPDFIKAGIYSEAFGTEGNEPWRIIYHSPESN